MPPRNKSTEPFDETAPPKPTGGLPIYRSESIATLTAKARSLHAEHVDNSAKIDALHYRNASIRRELAEIGKQVLEHAWDGQPIS